MPQGTPTAATDYHGPVAPPAQNEHAARDIEPFPAIGISACDNYAEVVRQCLNVHTYGKNRMVLRHEFSKADQAWKKALDAGTANETVAQQCTAFRDNFRAKLQAVGCTGV
jgi:hypothetical protein